MTKVAIGGEWKQLGRQSHGWSVKVAGDKPGGAAAKFDRLIGWLQEKHGYTRERAERELRRRMAKRQAPRPAQQVAALFRPSGWKS